MIPNNSLSSSVVLAPFKGARNRSEVNYYTDWEDGGVGIGDVSMGLEHQAWRGRIVGSNIVINPEFGADIVAYAGTGVITECSFTFDQTMKPVVAFIEDYVPKLYWYDSLIPGYVVTNLDPAIATPRVALDDKRESQVGNSDVILAYVKNGFLCYRQQRDRFLTEYTLASGLTTTLVKIGMNTKLRFQFLIGNM